MNWERKPYNEIGILPEYRLFMGDVPWARDFGVPLARMRIAHPVLQSQ